MRVFQGVGGAFLWANSAAILTDAFPSNQRGLALGTNMVAAIAGSFIGLVLGGVLGPVSWHLVFLVSVPFGLFGTVWAYLKLHDTGIRVPSSIDWWGNATFAVGLVSLLVGITYGILPYGSSSMGWTNPFVLIALAVGVVGLAVHHWRPAWLAKIHLISSPGGGGTGSTKPSSSSPTAPASIAKTTGTGPLSANVAVHASTYQVVVVTQAPCWIHVSSPTSSTPVFSSTVPAGTTKTFTSGNGQLSVELGASHATVTVQILGKTAPGWSLTPTSAPYVVNFSSTTG